MMPNYRQSSAKEVLALVREKVDRSMGSSFDGYEMTSVLSVLDETRRLLQEAVNGAVPSP